MRSKTFKVLLTWKITKLASSATFPLSSSHKIQKPWAQNNEGGGFSQKERRVTGDEGCVRAHFLVVRWGGGSDNKPGPNTHLHLSVLAPTFPPWVHTLPAKWQELIHFRYVRSKAWYGVQTHAHKIQRDQGWHLTLWALGEGAVPQKSGTSNKQWKNSLGDL